MKFYTTTLFTVLILSVSAPSYGATLYASSAAGGPGELYTLDPTNGAMVQDFGPLNDSSGLNYPVTGLAFSPTTGILYGSTGNSNPASQATLVTINPATALVTVVGAFNAGPINGSGDPATMADIAFDSAGNLFGVGSIGGPQLYSISLATGQATQVGAGTGLTSTSGGGVAIGPDGSVFGTPTSTRFGTYNSVTGAYTNITSPTKPVGGAYAALAFDGSTLYGLDLGPDSAGKPTELVTLNTATGAIADLGASVAQLDAIAFQVPEPTSILLCLIAIFAALIRGRR